ncbi:MAG TPA: AMP-binding protein [Kofleriaceae bacterium]|nr:AMP-binding protein [Kofleriaceae bacterium]
MSDEPIVLDDRATARHAAAIAEQLASTGVRAGDRVALLAGNHPGFVAARDAVTALGATLAPINPRLAVPEVEYIVTHARPRAVLVDRAHAPALPGALVVESIPRADTTAGIDRERAGATLLYTSGTTGRPKGCLRPDAAEAARIAELTATYALSADDTHLIACPLAHSAPGIFLRACRAAGARTVLLERFRAHAFLDAVVATRATLFFLVPTQWHRLLELSPAERAHDLSHVRAAIVAGAPISPSMKARIEEWLGPGKLYEFYGSSETGTITVAGPADHAAHPGSVGRAPAGVSVRIVDDEVFVRSSALMAGYLADDGTVSRPDERDGHISVGDLGRLDGDGWLTLVDRKHDTIISGGANVYPAEIERVLADHPGVAGAVVFGTPDPDLGDVVTALVASRSPAAPPTAAELTAFARTQLAGYKLPRRWATCAVAELPIGGSGKALRRAARAAFDAGTYAPLR